MEDSNINRIISWLDSEQNTQLELRKIVSEKLIKDGCYSSVVHAIYFMEALNDKIEDLTTSLIEAYDEIETLKKTISSSEEVGRSVRETPDVGEDWTGYRCVYNRNIFTVVYCDATCMVLRDESGTPTFVKSNYFKDVKISTPEYELFRKLTKDINCDEIIKDIFWEKLKDTIKLEV